jgi:hypothetical protein
VSTDHQDDLTSDSSGNNDSADAKTRPLSGSAESIDQRTVDPAELPLAPSHVLSPSMAPATVIAGPVGNIKRIVGTQDFARILSIKGMS